MSLNLNKKETEYKMHINLSQTNATLQKREKKININKTNSKININVR